MTTTPTKNESLPELPEPAFIGVPSPGCKVGYYTTFQMQEYARAALTREAPTEGVSDALRALLHAVCGETGFAAAVRADSGTPYPWPALDIAEKQAREALAATPPAPQRLAQEEACDVCHGSGEGGGVDGDCAQCRGLGTTQPPHHDRGGVTEALRAAYNCISELPPTQARSEVLQMIESAIGEVDD